VMGQEAFRLIFDLINHKIRKNASTKIILEPLVILRDSSQRSYKKGQRK